MTLQEILSFIEASENIKELGEIQRACKNRQEILVKEAGRRRAAEAWDRVKCHKHGDVLYCCAQGTFIGGPLQRGDKVTVYMVQPRKKLLWVTIQGRKDPIYFRPAVIARYDLRQFPPDNPATPQDRKFAERIGKAIKASGL